MKKFVLKLELNDLKHQRKAFKTVSALAGIDVISMDMKGKKLTVIGTVDPISVVIKLRKYWPTDIISVGPAKEPQKKEEPKKDEPKKEEAKKEEPKKEEPPKEEAKKEEPKKEEPKKEEEAKKKEEPKKEEKKKEEKKEEKKAEPEPMVGTIVPYRPQYPPPRPYYPPPIDSYYYVYHSMEENPNACVIC